MEQSISFNEYYQAVKAVAEEFGQTYFTAGFSMHHMGSTIHPSFHGSVSGLISHFSGKTPESALMLLAAAVADKKAGIPSVEIDMPF